MRLGRIRSPMVMTNSFPGVTPRAVSPRGDGWVGVVRSGVHGVGVDGVPVAGVGGVFPVVAVAGGDGLVAAGVVADGDLAGLGPFGDRDDEFQDAVAVAGLDVVQVQVVAED